MANLSGSKKTGALDENRTRDLFFTKEIIAGTTARFRVYQRLQTSRLISPNGETSERQNKCGTNRLVGSFGTAEHEKRALSNW